jgi:hypothetical protein
LGWSDISNDFIEALPRVDGKSVILSVVDLFPSMLILFHSVILTRPSLSHKPSLTALFAFMGFLSPSLVIVILSSQATFGGIYFGCLGYAFT